jgi:hypothetical protein
MQTQLKFNWINKAAHLFRFHDSTMFHPAGNSLPAGLYQKPETG